MRVNVIRQSWCINQSKETPPQSRRGGSLVLKIHPPTRTQRKVPMVLQLRRDQAHAEQKGDCMLLPDITRYSGAPKGFIGSSSPGNLPFNVISYAGTMKAPCSSGSAMVTRLYFGTQLWNCCSEMHSGALSVKIRSLWLLVGTWPLATRTPYYLTSYLICVISFHV